MKTCMWIAIAICILVVGVWYVQYDKASQIAEDEIGEGLEQDLAPIVREGIIGRWKSLDDAKFTREFKADGTLVDSYEGGDDLGGTWTVFSDQSPEDVAFPIESLTAYVQMAADGDLFNFKVIKLTPEELELIYMDRGGVLRFQRVQ